MHFSSFRLSSLKEFPEYCVQGFAPLVPAPGLSQCQLEVGAADLWGTLTLLTSQVSCQYCSPGAARHWRRSPIYTFRDIFPLTDAHWHLWYLMKVQRSSLKRVLDSVRGAPPRRVQGGLCGPRYRGVYRSLMKGLVLC